MQFRNDIQGLRAIAFLLVFLFHLNSSWLPGGFIGVDIFFVISGYLVSSIILYKKEKNSFELLDFYIGRIKRIVPAYIFFLIIIFLLGSFIYFPMDIFGLRNNVFQAAIFNSNNYLGSLDTYFGASSSENPMLHTWTLAIEMQFYFILPILLMFFSRKALFPILIFSIAILLGYSYYNSTYLSDKNGMYFSLLARMPEFLIGTLIAVKGSILTIQNSKLRNIATLIAFFALIATSFALNEESNFPGLLVLIPCISVAVILTNYNSFFNQSILSNKVLVYIGELSYSLYLWHWGFMALLRYSNLRYEFTHLEMVLLTITTFAFSYISYKYIENYFRKTETKSFAKLIPVPFIILGILAFYAPKVNNAIYPIPKQYSKATFGLKSHSDTFESAERFGDLNKENDSILLIGDSFALMYKHVLDEIGKKNSFNFLTVTNDGTPLIPGIIREDFSNDKLFLRYSNLISHSTELIKQSNVILIASSWRSEEITSLTTAFETFAKSLNSNQKVLILSNFPSLDKNPIKLNRGISRNVDADNNYLLETRPVPDSIKEVIKKYPNLYLMDKVNYSEFSSELPFNNDTIMYYDEHHLNIYGTDFFSKRIEIDFIKQWDLILNN